MSILGKLRQAGRWKASAFLIAVVLLLLAYGGASTGDERHAPLSFDPLSEREEAHAVDVALSNPVVSLLLARYETIGAALNTDKDRLRAEPSSRAADVWFYDYTTDLTVQVLVDLRKDRVLTYETATYQPPITAAEMGRAGASALADARVQEALAERQMTEGIDTMARLWTGDGPTACPVHRCALVAFLVDGGYEPGLFVRVNLSLDRVEDMLSTQGGAHEDGPHAPHHHGEVPQ